MSRKCTLHSFPQVKDTYQRDKVFVPCFIPMVQFSNVFFGDYFHLTPFPRMHLRLQHGHHGHQLQDHTFKFTRSLIAHTRRIFQLTCFDFDIWQVVWVCILKRISSFLPIPKELHREFESNYLNTAYAPAPLQDPWRVSWPTQRLQRKQL